MNEWKILTILAKSRCVRWFSKPLTKWKKTSEIINLYSLKFFSINFFSFFSSFFVLFEIWEMKKKRRDNRKREIKNQQMRRLLFSSCALFVHFSKKNFRFLRVYSLTQLKLIGILRVTFFLRFHMFWKIFIHTISREFQQSTNI